MRVGCSYDDGGDALRYIQLGPASGPYGAGLSRKLCVVTRDIGLVYPMQRRTIRKGKGDKGNGIKLRQLPAHQTPVCATPATSLLDDFD